MTRSFYKSLLWELFPENGKSSYLFGTIHLPDQSLFFRVPEVVQLISRCDGFMAEYPLDRGGDESDIHPNFLIGGSGSLRDIMRPKAYSRLRNYLLKAFSIDLLHYDRLKPMLIEQLISSGLVEFPSNEPMDALLWRSARDMGKLMYGAESYESQLDLMERFPLDWQLRNLLRISRNSKNYRRHVYKMMQYYLDENLPALYRSSVKSLSDMKHMLVYERNIKIADQIDMCVREHTMVCAVGAGHLYGHKGLLRLLKAKGYAIKPVYR